MKVVFLDRDGTLIIDPSDLRVDSVDEIELFPDTIRSMKYLADNGFAVVIITNQAGIAEGRFSEDKFWEIHNSFLGLLQPAGINVLKTYVSPHSKTDAHDWRKPNPGMLLQAAKDFKLDLSEIYMVGDRLSDIHAGINAGTKTILIKTGNEDVSAPEADYTAPHLLDAIKYITKH